VQDNGRRLHGSGGKGSDNKHVKTSAKARSEGRTFADLCDSYKRYLVIVVAVVMPAAIMISIAVMIAVVPVAAIVVTVIIVVVIGATRDHQKGSGGNHQ